MICYVNRIQTLREGEPEAHLHSFAKCLHLISSGTVWKLFEKILASLYNQHRFSTMNATTPLACQKGEHRHTFCSTGKLAPSEARWLLRC